MSNIIKWNYINFDQSEKHVVDSDQKINQKERIIGEDIRLESGLLSGVHFASPQDLIDDFLQADTGIEKEDSPYDSAMEEERIAEKANSLLFDARNEAEEILKDAKAQAEQIKQEAYETGQKEGYEEGLRQAQAHLEEKERELSQTKNQLLKRADELEQAFDEKCMELEPFFAHLTGELVTRLTGVMLEEKKDIILHLVKTGLLGAGESNHYIVHLSSEQLALVKENKQQLETVLPKGAVLECREDQKLQKNQCRIETEGTMIDSSLDVMLENLRLDLKMLSRQ